MRSILKSFKAGLVGAAMAVTAMSASAVLIDASTNNPYNFTWSFNTGSSTLSGTGSLTVSGFNSSSLTVGISLTNNALLASERLTAFGFGIDPNATGVSFSDAADGGMVDAALGANFPAIQDIEVCSFGGVNCAGGSNGGINGGASDSFSVILAGTWGSSVTIAPIGFKYQTGYGSFEFTTSSSSSSSSSSGTPPGSGGAPEPASSALALLGLGLLGASFWSRRKA